ncbi:MAG: dihydrodipicolinate reductase [Pseudomonadota bacterium]
MVRKLVKLTVFTLALAAASSVAAMDKVSSRDAFLEKLDGRELTIRLYGLSLEVTDDGRIGGRAVGRPVTGAWTWEDGYFCREMQWGQRPIPYNCQLVQADGDVMRFTTDRGEGDYADFRLR